MLVRIADDLGDAGKSGEFLGGTLGVASGDHDLRVRVFAMDAADGGTRVLVSRCSDGTGVEHDYFGASDLVGALESALLELTFDGSTIGLGGPTSEILDVEGGHIPILTVHGTALRARDWMRGDGRLWMKASNSGARWYWREDRKHQ